MNRTARRTSALIAAAIVAVGGCGGGDGGGDGDGDAPDSKLLATTTVWADIASRVACGEPVDSVIPAGVDPHTYEPSLRDRERLGNAELVIANGADLEESVLDMLDTVAAEGIAVVEMASYVELHDDAHDDGLDHDHDDGLDHGHAHGNPHFWLDPVRVATAIDALAAALGETKSAPGALRECTDEYLAELSALDREISAAVARIPAGDRLLVTNHDELGYFAERYGFEVIGTVIESSSTVAETDAATLEALSQTIRERGAPAIFVEASESSVDAAALADRLGIPVVPLTTASLSDDGPSSTYVGMLSTMADAIVGALEP